MPDYQHVLSAAYSIYVKAHEFKAGDLVRWKPGMRNKRFPAVDAPAVVVRALAEGPRDAPQDAQVEEQDIVLGIVDGSGRFVLFAYDSGRFQPWHP